MAPRKLTPEDYALYQMQLGAFAFAVSKMPLEQMIAGPPLDLAPGVRALAEALLPFKAEAVRQLAREVADGKG